MKYTYEEVCETLGGSGARYGEDGVFETKIIWLEKECYGVFGEKTDLFMDKIFGFVATVQVSFVDQDNKHLGTIRKKDVWFDAEAIIFSENDGGFVLDTPSFIGNKQECEQKIKG
jgi:hypothetical protein